MWWIIVRKHHILLHPFMTNSFEIYTQFLRIVVWFWQGANFTFKPRYQWSSNEVYVLIWCHQCQQFTVFENHLKSLFLIQLWILARNSVLHNKSGEMKSHEIRQIGGRSRCNFGLKIQNHCDFPFVMPFRSKNCKSRNLCLVILT